MSKGKKKTIDELILEELKKKEYAVDQYDSVYVKIQNKNTGGKFFSVEARELQDKLVLDFGMNHNIMLSSSKSKDAKIFAGAFGRQNGRQVRAAHRFACVDGIDYIDMADEMGNVLQITSETVEVSQSTPVIFRNLKTKLPVKVAESDGDPRLFLKYAHCRDEAQEMLLLVDLCLSCKSGIDQPPTCFTGPQGSGKTETANFFRKVFDPTTTEKEDTLNTKEQLALLADSNAIILLDNMTRFKAGLAEQIKKIVTGCTLQKRQLYTDSDMLQYYLHNKFLITSIDVPCLDADFLDRALIFEFDRFTQHNNKGKQALDAMFQDDVPYIRRGCLEALAKAKSLYPNMKFESASRMADYETWGATVAVVLGYTQDEYVEAFRASQAQYRNEFVKKPAEPLVRQIVCYINEFYAYDGLVSVFYEQIKNNFSVEDLKHNKCPTSLVSFGKALSRVEADLEEFEIKLTRSKDRKAGSIIKIEKIAKAYDNLKQSGNEIINYETGEVYLRTETDNVDTVGSDIEIPEPEEYDSDALPEDDDRYNHLCQKCQEFTLNSDNYDGRVPFCLASREEPRKDGSEYHCPDYLPVLNKKHVYESTITDNIFE